MQKFRKTGFLAHTQICSEVSWPTKTITSNAWRQDSIRINLIKILQSASREISSRSDERIIVSILQCATEIMRWSRRTNEVLRIRTVNALPSVRRPRESSMCCDDSINLPAPQDLT